MMKDAMLNAALAEVIMSMTLPALTQDSFTFANWAKGSRSLRNQRGPRLAPGLALPPPSSPGNIF